MRDAVEDVVEDEQRKESSFTRASTINPVRDGTIYS
jgi:hypothetical protein